MGRHRVCFFDLEHRIKRTLEIEAASPLEAAEAALRVMIQRDRFVSDFAEVLEIEVINTSRLSLSLTDVARRINAPAPHFIDGRAGGS